MLKYWKENQNWNWKYKAGLLEGKKIQNIYSVEVKNFGRSNPHNAGTEMNLVSLILLEKVLGILSVFCM